VGSLALSVLGLLVPLLAVVVVVLVLGGLGWRLARRRRVTSGRT
jgi:hypothetical protein